MNNTSIISKIGSSLWSFFSIINSAAMPSVLSDVFARSFGDNIPFTNITNRQVNVNSPIQEVAVKGNGVIPKRQSIEDRAAALKCQMQAGKDRGVTLRYLFDADESSEDEAPFQEVNVPSQKTK